MRDSQYAKSTRNANNKTESNQLFNRDHKGG